MDVRYGNSPKEAKHFTTEEARENLLIEALFKKDEVLLTYSHIDRIIVGGIMPVDKALVLEAGKEIAADYFLERRELGIVNIGGEGTLIADDMEYNIHPRDGMYIGQGTKELKFASKDKNNPAKFYIASAPAHKTYPTVYIEASKTNPVPMGDKASCNKRTINQYVHPAICQSCQLLMGLTVLDEGSIWNTMPAHTHDRRMEVYLYFDMDPESRVFHLWGEPEETRHLVVANEQAVISPSWSIHSGVGTSAYTFIWAMVGENQTFTDMDHLAISDLK